MKKHIILFILLVFTIFVKGQHSFSGHVDNERWHNNVYLSVVEDYRKLFGIYPEQIISKIETDSLGYFEFTGDQLESTNRIYRIHVDSCEDEEQNINHFDGHCSDSREILFIAKHNDTINLPFSLDDQMFCEINSNNEHANVFVKIDSIKENMRYAFAKYRSEANRKLNNKKWFKTLQDYGKSLNEPLAELYIYAFLSDRSNAFHEYYIEDLKSNPYYDNLLDRLNKAYPNSPYIRQYKAELNSDKYIITGEYPSTTSQKENFIWIILLLLSIGFNIFLIFKLKTKNKTEKKDKIESLTKQEQNILNLILKDKTNKQIAAELFVSISTVKTHTNNIYKKLGVQSRTEVKNLYKKYS